MKIGYARVSREERELPRVLRLKDLGKFTSRVGVYVELIGKLGRRQIAEVGGVKRSLESLSYPLGYEGSS